MESNQRGIMRISWVLSNHVVIDPTVEINTLKNIGPFWGGWKTWRSYNTDNVVCHDTSQASKLINNNFHSRCNLHIPSASFQDLGRPQGVRLYQGEFNQLVDDPDDIVSMHLAAGNSDIVLLIGFDLQSRETAEDKLVNHKWHNYKHYVLHLIKDNPDVQWVILDHPGQVEKMFKDLPNLLFDNLNNVLTQFS